VSGILITGGAGFIGSHLVERLLNQGERVVVLDDFNEHYSPAIKRHNVAGVMDHPSYTLVEGDLRDQDTVKEVFGSYSFDRVVHLAARANARASLLDPLLYEEVNVKGTLNLLAVCRDLQLRNILVASSSSVYGNSSRVPYREDDPADRPVSHYAATKRSVELHCHTYHELYGLPISCFRFFTVYGPRQRPDMAFHIFARLIVSGQPIKMYGDGSTLRDYTYISDIIDGLTAALETPREFEIVNLGNTKTVSLSRALEVVQKALGKEATIEVVPEQPGDVRLTNADVSKAGKLYGYSPKVDIEEGMQHFAEWFLNARKEGIL
jgi:UDP-glucuronate 4-epimerase